jgi:hypothetical protein
MRILCSVVQAFMLPMLDAGHDFSLCSGIAGQFVRNHHAGCPALLLEQLLEQAFGCFGIAAALNQDIEHGSVLIDGPPQPMLLAGDADRNLIKMPFVSGYGQAPADLIGKALAKLQRPLPHRLMTDQGTAGCKHLLHHAQAQWKPEVQPDGMADHFSRVTVASITRMTVLLHPSRMSGSRHLRVKLTVPLGSQKPMPRSSSTQLGGLDARKHG